ncbi:hypothetical protein [Microlunatus spumicola]|uniref:hypothetical protein n=1 Tax=Microlunatus spumicola TaxID=81499 RepID=UPI0031D45746
MISTCTGPQRVDAASPVYVFVPDEEPEELDDPEDEDPEEEAPDEAEGVDDGSGGAVADGVPDGVAGALEALPAAVAGVLVEVW